jgi:peptide/nickel transport system substrate-binding protein
MGLKKKHLVCVGLFVAVSVLLLTNPLRMTAVGEEAKSTWVWTKERPKPAWWKWDYGKDKPVRGGYIKKAYSRYIGLMNPNHWPVYDWVAMTQMYEDIAYIEGDFKPSFLWLAKSYEYTDPVTCIMKLRKGITFHDGTDFNAEAVKYLMDWMKDKKNGAWTRAWIRPIKSVEVVDEHTVKWNFSEPWAGFMGMMATTPGYMISKKALEGDVALIEAKKLEGKLKTAKKKLDKAEKKAQKAQAQGGEKAKKAMAKAEKARKKVDKIEEQYAKAAEKAKGAKPLDKYPVGTGRYMYEEGRPGNYLKLKRNPNWWFAKSIGQPDMPYPDGLISFVIADLSVRLANLKAGKIHYMGLSASQYNMLKNNPDLKITTQAGYYLTGLRFNTQKGPAKDIRVRKAISHALDRKALLAGVAFNQGRIASAMYHKEHWCHNPNLKPVAYDPELSKKLLAQAGYPNGLKITGYMSNLPDAVTLTEAVKNMLAQVGIDWDVDSLDNVAASDRMRNAEFDLAGGGWSYIKDPDMMASGYFHPDGGFNFGSSHNEKAIPLIEAGNSELDEDKRQKIYWELERVLYENYEQVWLWWPFVNTARRHNLLGYNNDLHTIGQEGFWFSHPEYLKDGKE